MWDTDTDWKKGTYDNDIEVSGVGISAVIWPYINYGSGTINYNTSTDYDLSSGDLEISSGKAQLLATSTNYGWGFSASADYSFGSNIVLTGGSAQLTPTTVTTYAWYHLNESSGTTATDSSGNGRDGTLINSPTWVAGKLNNAIQFAVTQYINLGNIAAFERTDVFSCEAWIYSTDLSVNRGIVSKLETAPNYKGWSFVILSTGKLRVQLISAYATNALLVQGSTTLLINNWYHVVMTYDGSSSPTGIKMYVNGVLQTNTTDQNNLSASIVTTNPLYIGMGSNGGVSFLGKIDEVVIYNKVLDLVEISYRYNSSSGIETMPNNYAITNPAIYPTTGIVFGSAITSYSETSTKPTNTEIKYQISSDDGVTWKYWNGSAWIASDLSYTQANLASLINTNISTLAASGIFRFRALLSSTGYVTPLLDQITIVILSYPTIDNLYVTTKNSSQLTTIDILNWYYLVLTSNTPTGTEMRFLFSTDGRVTWLTWNGSSWVAPADATIRTNATSITDASNKFYHLPIGSGTLDIRVFLYTTNSTYTPYIDNFSAQYNKGFFTSANYLTNIFDSGIVNQPWNVFDVSKIEPAGTSAVIKVRTSNYLSSMGTYSSALITGQNIGLNGQFIQFSVDFVGTNTARALVDYISVLYTTPLIQDVLP
jgi:hypothetical protein